MSNEITISGTLKLRSGYLDVARARGTFRVDQSAQGAHLSTTTAGTTEAELGTGDISTVGWAFLRNLDSNDDNAHGVTFGIDVGGTYRPFGKMLSGEPALVRFAVDAVEIRSCELEDVPVLYCLFED